MTLNFRNKNCVFEGTMPRAWRGDYQLWWKHVRLSAGKYFV